MCWSATCYYVRTVAQRTISQARTIALRPSKLSRWRIDWTLINAQQDMHKTVVAMLATGLSCTATDLVDGQVHITVRSPDAHENPAHRLFPPHPGKIGIASMGTGGIVCVDEPHRKWAEDVFGGADPDRDDIFIPARMGRMARLVRPEGLILYAPFPRFAVTRNSLVHVGAPDGYTVRVVGRDGADSIENRGDWYNAIHEDPSGTASPRWSRQLPSKMARSWESAGRRQIRRTCGNSAVTFAGAQGTWHRASLDFSSCQGSSRYRQAALLRHVRLQRSFNENCPCGRVQTDVGRGIIASVVMRAS